MVNLRLILAIYLINLAFTNLAFGFASGSSGGSSGLGPNADKTRLGGNFIQYSSELHEGFGSNTTGYGGEIARVKNASIFSFLALIRGGLISGRELFMDSTTERNLTFTTYFVQPHIGVHINMLPRVDNGFNLYLGAHGGLGYHYLRFSSSATFTELTKTYSGLGFGYEYVAGVEYVWKNMTGKTVGLFAEIQLIDFSSNLVERSNFTMDGVGFSGGLIW